jgi:hypothetical protein
VLLLATGCSLVSPSASISGDAVYTVDPNTPFVVVTVGGSPAAKATEGVAATIPDSTPLPRLDLPTPDPAAPTRPVASPSLSQGGSAASRAARQPGNAVHAGTP